MMMLEGENTGYQMDCARMVLGIILHTVVGEAVQGLEEMYFNVCIRVS